ncbi:MAG: AAA family ATPase [Acidimicrobiia bacterium]
MIRFAHVATCTEDYFRNMEWPMPPLPGRLLIEGRLPFVGRRQELEVIESAWDRVEQGARHVIFVGGAPGAGKTRLVAETAAALYQNGVAVLFGSSFADYTVPYQPFVEILENLFDASGEALWKSIPESARPLVRLEPRIAVHRPDLRPEREEGRRELFSAFTDLIRTLSEVRPVTLVLEDLHWAQEPTRQLLSHLVQTTSGERLLIIATFRTTAPDRDAQLTRSIADLYRLPGVKRIDLEGLEVSDIAVLIGASGEMRIGDQMSSAVVLRDQTGGNPFFVCELIAHDSLQRADLPATVLDALDLRLGILSDSATRAIGLAAILGNDFDSHTLVAAAGGDIHVLDGLAEAMRAGLTIETRAEGDPVFRFAHSLTRQAVIDRMALGHRASLHALVARAIEATTPPSGHRHAVLAHHYREANDSSRATEAAMEAAAHAEESLAYEEAAFWYSRAAEADEPDRVKWLLAAATNLGHAGDFERARALFRDLVNTAEPAVAAQAAIGFEDTSFFEGLNGHEAAMVIDRALEKLSPDPSDPLYVLLLARKARALVFSGDPRAGEVGDRAIDMARASGDERLMSQVSIASINQVLTPDFAENNREHIRQAFDWAVESGTRSEVINVASVVTALAYFEGDNKTYVDARDVATRTSALTEFTFWTSVVAGVACADEYIRGNLAEARTIATETRRRSRRAGLRFDEGPFSLQKFIIEREAGRLEPIRAIAEGIDAASRLWEPGLIALYIELGLIDKARQMIESFFDVPLEERRDPALWPASLALISEAVVAINHRRGAEILRPEVLRYSGFNLMSAAMVATFGAADRHIAQLDAMLGEPTAEQYFQSALELDIRMGATLHVVETLIAHAAFLERSSDHEQLARAAEYRRQAKAHAERKGLIRQLRRLDTSTTLRSDRPAGLTPREIEVLRLVAKGLSNNDIADRLFISQNTAANHVRSILTKTRAPNRTKAAIFAAENGLLN